MGSGWWSKDNYQLALHTSKKFSSDIDLLMKAKMKALYLLRMATISKIAAAIEIANYLVHRVKRCQ